MPLTATSSEDARNSHFAQELGPADVLEILVLVESHADEKGLKELNVSVPVCSGYGEPASRRQLCNQVELWFS